MAVYYSVWYPKTLLPSLGSFGDLHPILTGHMTYVQSTSKHLARAVFHQMMKYQKKLESKQAILNRIVDIGTELFAMATACSYAESLYRDKQGKENSIDLANVFCQASRKRIEALFKDAQCNHDSSSLAMAKKILGKSYEWMENEIIK